MLSLLREVPYTHSHHSCLVITPICCLLIGIHSISSLIWSAHCFSSLIPKSDNFLLPAANFQAGSVDSGFCLSVSFPGRVFFYLSDVLFPGATCANPTLILSSSPWVLCHSLDTGTRGSWTKGSGHYLWPSSGQVLAPVSGIHGFFLLAHLSLHQLQMWNQPAPGSDFKRSGKNIVISLSLPGLRSQIPDVSKPRSNYSIYI